ncbi:MAG: chemotaxis protein CheR, partial [Armatimonadetes bacterium]|nr:chemotaxis protein CheR [Anaerolineae bacterium]
AFADTIGFSQIALELQAVISPPDPQGMQWETFIQVAPNPRVPSLAEAMRQALNDDETAAFSAHLRSLMEAGQGRTRQALAYLQARK